MTNFEGWIVDALEAYGGKASVLAVSKHIWNNHKKELGEDEKTFFTWQYQVRWAATKLRKRGIMKSVDQSQSKAWELA